MIASSGGTLQADNCHTKLPRLTNSWKRDGQKPANNYSHHTAWLVCVLLSACGTLSHWVLDEAGLHAL